MPQTTSTVEQVVAEALRASRKVVEVAEAAVEQVAQLRLEQSAPLGQLGLEIEEAMVELAAQVVRRLEELEELARQGPIETKQIPLLEQMEATERYLPPLKARAAVVAALAEQDAIQPVLMVLEETADREEQEAEEEAEPETLR